MPTVPVRAIPKAPALLGYKLRIYKVAIINFFFTCVKAIILLIKVVIEIYLFMKRKVKTLGKSALQKLAGECKSTKLTKVRGSAPWGTYNSDGSCSNYPEGPCTFRV